MNRFLPRALMAPAVATLFLWMIVPLLMTIYFSLIRYNLMQPESIGFAGLANYEYFVTDPSFATAVGNTLLLLGTVIAITVVGGVALALLIVRWVVVAVVTVRLAFLLWRMSPKAFFFALAVVLAALGIPVEVLIRRREAELERQRRAHICLTCGYDCRATPGRCPECGRAPGELP